MKKKSEFITKDYLDKTLDKRFSEQAKVILEAISELSDENKREHQRLETKIDKGLKELGNKMDDNWNNIEKYVKAQEAFRQEFIIMKKEIKQIKTVIKEKLGVEIRAI